MLYFAEFVINSLNKYSSLFKTVNFNFISQPKHMLWVLKTYVKTDG